MDTIVVGVDGSLQSVKAFQAAVGEAKARGAKVFVVSALTKPLGYSTHLLEEHWRKQTAAYEIVHEKLGRMARRKGVLAVCTVDHGSPAKAITDAAAKTRAQAVFVGYRGSGLRGRVKHFLLGSVSAEVVRKANCVVTIVK